MASQVVKKGVKVLGAWDSPFGKRVEWALKLKGIDYDYVEEDLKNKSPLLLQLNPVYKKVPVLVHHQKPIAESFLILQYIDETWKHNPLLPLDPYGRATARFWAQFAEDKGLKIAMAAMCSEGERKEKAVKSLTEAMEYIEGEANNKGKNKFFGGEDNIGYLDIAIGWISHWLPVWEEVGSMTILDPIKFPAITAWSTDFTSHPVIKHNLPPRDKMVTSFHRLRKVLAPVFSSSPPHAL